MRFASRSISVRSEDDIVAEIDRARERGTRVRAVGAGGSQNGNHHTDGTTLRFDQYKGAVEVDGQLVTVQAGLTCGDLHRILAGLGQTLPTAGEWKHATIAGALGAGTHGGSLSHGILATSVRRVRFVTGEGQVVEVDRSHPWFEHVGVSLGALGVVSQVTFECPKAFWLGLERRVVSLDAFLHDHDRQSRANEFYSAVWIPRAGSVITYAANRVPACEATAARPQRFDLSTLLLHAASQYVDLQPLLASGRFHSYTVGYGGDILTPIGTSPGLVHATQRHAGFQRETEFAVPWNRGVEAISALDDLARRHSGALANGIGLRASPADDFALSPCSRRDTLWISVFHRPLQPFASRLRDLFQRLDARCHWGKHVALSPRYLHHSYPRKEAFLDLQALLDPDDLFGNDFTRRFGLSRSPHFLWQPEATCA